MAKHGSRLNESIEPLCAIDELVEIDDRADEYILWRLSSKRSIDSVDGVLQVLSTTFERKIIKDSEECACQRRQELACPVRERSIEI
jgi:hypothetical protein